MSTQPTQPATPTQLQRPWRATARTVFQALIAFAVVVPFIVEASGLDPQVYPWLGAILAVAAASTRIMAIPQVEAFLAAYLPFLAAEPKAKGNVDDRGDTDVVGIVLIVLLLVVVLILLGVLG